ncbi:MAG: M13 family metallopeptidase [Alphaproteobacteria bacterium]|nr:M13 family metallopeptidase [Alphaproteobacteria bacterium]MBL6939994.1 M13 family metallopeptidase [Alphaproteobacteria bacterium]MBL7098150.1 M13 family metallopeptidase [Alphaproteobacteria bacterium]
MKIWSVCALGAAMAVATLALATDAKPQYGDFGFDQAGQDLKTKPGDDFFRFANGAWIDKAVIAPDKPSITLRLLAANQTEAHIHEILEAAAAHVAHQPTTVEGKVGAYYHAFMDEAHIEQLGATPLKPLLDEVKAANDRAALAAFMGRNNYEFGASIFGLGLDVDLKDPKHYAAYLSQDGLDMPDRDYYLKADFAKQKAAYETYVATMLGLIGWNDPAGAAKKIVAFETAIANASWTRAQQRDPVATYNKMSLADLQKLAPQFDWMAYLRAAKMGGLTTVIVNEKSAFPAIAKVYADTPVDTLQAWEAFRIADNAAPLLSKAFVNAHFEFHAKTLTGQAELAPRWKRAVHAVSGGDSLAGGREDYFGTMGWAVGELYTAKYFPPSAKAKITQLVLDLKAAFHARIEKLDWMSPMTKEDALKKLDTYVIKVGYPDKPRDYSKLVITDDDAFGDARRTAEHAWDFYVARFGGSVDRGDWGMTPQTNDAYNGELRDIVFPAAILTPPIFDANADAAINYGAAGGVIGHELTHGFDDQGRQFDATGALRDWWAPKDAAIFKARAAMLGAQYSSYEPLPGAKVNGDLTMGENIADLGGLTLALEAYHASLHGKPAPVLGGLTGDQRVFLAWAQAWRGKVKDDFVRRQVVSDPHSPRQFRVNGPARNIDLWYETFGVKPGDKLYLPPEKRVHIW